MSSPGSPEGLTSIPVWKSALAPQLYKLLHKLSYAKECPAPLEISEILISLKKGISVGAHLLSVCPSPN